MYAKNTRFIADEKGELPCITNYYSSQGTKLTTEQKILHTWSVTMIEIGNYKIREYFKFSSKQDGSIGHEIELFMSIRYHRLSKEFPWSVIPKFGISKWKLGLVSHWSCSPRFYQPLSCMAHLSAMAPEKVSPTSMQTNETMGFEKRKPTPLWYMINKRIHIFGVVHNDFVDRDTQGMEYQRRWGFKCFQRNQKPMSWWKTTIGKAALP